MGCGLSVWCVLVSEGTYRAQSSSCVYQSQQQQQLGRYGPGEPGLETGWHETCGGLIRWSRLDLERECSLIWNKTNYGK